MASRVRLTSPPTRRTSANERGVKKGITPNTELWTMPKGALPKHPRYHPTLLFYKEGRRPWALVESLVYHIFEIIAPDLCPTVYLTPGARASLMRWVSPSVTTATKARLSRNYNKRFTRQQTIDAANIDVIDALTNNADRHPGNALLYRYRLIPIDHGLAFGYGRATKIRSPFSHYIPQRWQATWRATAYAALERIEANATRLLPLVNEGYKQCRANFIPYTKVTLLAWVKEARKQLRGGDDDDDNSCEALSDSDDEYSPNDCTCSICRRN